MYVTSRVRKINNHNHHHNLPIDCNPHNHLEDTANFDTGTARFVRTANNYTGPVGPNIHRVADWDFRHTAHSYCTYSIARTIALTVSPF